MFLLLIVCAFTGESLSLASQAGSPQSLTNTRTTYGLVHGTIDVIVSTREGFALASDSRILRDVGTGSSYSDDGEKLFTIGDHAALVIAGLVGSQITGDGCTVRDAIGTQMRLLDRSTKDRLQPLSAFDIATDFRNSLDSVASLLSGGVNGRQKFVGQASIVSFNPDGTSEWVKIDLPVEVKSGEDGKVWPTVGAPVYQAHSGHAEREFDVDLLGQPAIAEKMLSARSPSADWHTRTPIMRRYYASKQNGTLNQFTLQEGVSLAEELVQATIDLAPASAGVGGPIDIATVTKTGIHWIQHKANAEALPPSHFLITNSHLSPQVLDDLECVHCDFTNAKLFYAGKADVVIVDGKFGGSCRLALSPDAESRRPAVVTRLRAFVQNKCQIVVQSSNYP